MGDGGGSEQRDVRGGEQRDGMVEELRQGGFRDGVSFVRDRVTFGREEADKISKYSAFQE